MGFRISLRELLVLVALLAAAFVLLKFASPPIARIIVGISILTWGAMVIIAFIERGPRQAFAIGFTVIAAVFLLPIGTQSKGDPHIVLGTEDLLVYLHRQMATRWVYDTNTGERLRPAPLLETEGGIGPPPRSRFMASDDHFTAPAIPFGAPPSSTHFNFYPFVSNFIAVGNSLLTLLFAYLGGKLAVWIYHRRVARECDKAKGVSDNA